MFSDEPCSMGNTANQFPMVVGRGGGLGAEAGNKICTEINKVLHRAQRRREEKIVCSDAVT